MQQDRSVHIEQHNIMIIKILLVTSLCVQLTLTTKSSHWRLDPEKYRKRFLFSVSPFVNYFWVLPMPSVRFVSGRHQLRKHKLRQKTGVCSKNDETTKILNK